MTRSWQDICINSIAFGIMAFAVVCPPAPAQGDDTASGATGDSNQPKVKDSFSGNISWYGPGFNGRKTASGELFDLRKPTAAHRRLPFFTKVLVEDPKTGKSCIVRVNDRGPFVKTRVMDISQEGMRRVSPVMPGLLYADCLVLDDN